MAGNYIPVKQQALDAFAQNFSTLITANPGAYGLMASDAVQIATQTNLFHASLTLVLNPATKTKATVADKNGKKAAMLQVLRIYAQMIKLNQGVSDLAKAALGLTIDDTTKSPTPVPANAPQLGLAANGSMRQTVRVSDSTDPTRKSKPAGVQGTVLLVAVGTVPPASPSSAAFNQLVTKQTADLQFGSGDIGENPYVMGAYYNPAGELGPYSAMVSLPITA